MHYICVFCSWKGNLNKAILSQNLRKLNYYIIPTLMLSQSASSVHAHNTNFLTDKIWLATALLIN